MKQPAQRTTKRPRKGMTLVEVMFALSLLTMIAVTQTNLTLKLSEQQRSVSLGAYRTAVLTASVNKFMAMPYDSLPVRAGCTTVSAASASPFGYVSCVAVTDITGTERQVQIVLTPAALTRVDTVLFLRARNAASSPLGP